VMEAIEVFPFALSSAFLTISFASCPKEERKNPKYKNSRNSEFFISYFFKIGIGTLFQR